jgi:hypothetical protein
LTAPPDSDVRTCGPTGHVDCLLKRCAIAASRKTREGACHPDRDAQFRYIDRLAQAALRQQQPVISVDTKKKELIGDFKNAGRAWRPKGGSGSKVGDRQLVACDRPLIIYSGSS